jgi:ribosomal protein L29
MKKLIFVELENKSIKDLLKVRKEMQKDLYDLKMKNAIKALKQTHLITIAKKNIAKINTALTRKIKV